MRMPASARVGLCAIVFGILAFVLADYWLNSRTLTLVDMPVSLAPGHIRTGEFKINVEAVFSVQVRFPYDDTRECPYADGLRIRSLTSIGSQAVQLPENRGAVMAGPYLGAFVGKPGRYALDVKVLSATQDLDRCKPRLLIEAAGYEFSQRQDEVDYLLFPFFAFCELLGLTLIVICTTAYSRTRALEKIQLNVSDVLVAPASANQAALKVDRISPAVRVRENAPHLSLRLSERTPAWGITGLRHTRRSAPHAWARGPAGNVPAIALVIALVWFVAFIPIWFVYTAGHRTIYGLMVLVTQEGDASHAAWPGLTAPLVRVDAHERVYLNYEQTTWEQLPAKLEAALRGLPMRVRVVYVDGDADIPFMDVVRAVDVVEGAGARPILLTPRSKNARR